MRIAIIGGSGNLGTPVAKALLSQGHHVTIVTRDVSSTRKKMGDEFEYAQASLHEPDSLTQALKSAQAIHINLAGYTKTECETVIHQGTVNIVKVAKALNIKLISFISGTTVFEANRSFYDIDAKLKAESAIQQSGIPYLIFCPSWFMESLPNFINQGRASIFGPGKVPIHWLSTQDYARIVVQCYESPKYYNQRLFLHGPQALSLSQALAVYLDHMHPQLKLSHAPYWLATILTWLTGDKKIRYAADLCRYYEKVGDMGDPQATRDLLGDGLGTPTLHLQQWSEQQAAQQNPDNVLSHP